MTVYPESLVAGFNSLMAIPVADARYVEIVECDAIRALVPLLNEQVLRLKIKVSDIFLLHRGRDALVLLRYVIQRHGAKQVLPLGCTQRVPVIFGFERQRCVVAPEEKRKMALVARFVTSPGVFLGKHRSSQALQYGDFKGEGFLLIQCFFERSRNCLRTAGWPWTSTKSMV